MGVIWLFESGRSFCIKLIPGISVGFVVDYEQGFVVLDLGIVSFQYDYIGMGGR